MGFHMTFQNSLVILPSPYSLLSPALPSFILFSSYLTLLVPLNNLSYFIPSAVYPPSLEYCPMTSYQLPAFRGNSSPNTHT